MYPDITKHSQGSRIVHVGVILKVQLMLVKQKKGVWSSSFFPCVLSFSTFSDDRDSTVRKASALELAG